MANEELIARLKLGCEAWNLWRKEHPDATLDLDGVTLRAERLKTIDFAGATLKKAILARAMMERANLRGADLEGANLAGTFLEDADLTGAKLDGADLTDAYLARADLTGASLRGAKLKDAFLTEANFTDAVLTGATLQGAMINKVTLVRCDLSFVTGLTEKQLSRARLDDSCRLPDGFTLPEAAKPAHHSPHFAPKPDAPKAD